MEFLAVAAQRQSCRAFAEGRITEEELKTLLRAANAAPVANGQYQDFCLAVMQSGEMIAKLEKHAHETFDWVPEHPLYGLSNVIAIHGRLTDNMEAQWASAACIADHILLSATDLGLASVYLMAVPVTARFSPELCAEIGVPEGFAPLVMVGVGTPAEKQEPRSLTTERLDVAYIR